MKLGEALYELPFPDNEKVRLSETLKDRSSLPYRVYAEHHTSSSQFDAICRKMVRKITGFRPTSEVYRNRVSAHVLKDLEQNKASPDRWMLYKNSVASFVISNLSALNQLLLDTELPDSLTVNTKNIVSEITSHAKDFSVNDKDVETLYELWPMERLDDVRAYLDRCPKFDRFRAIESTMKSFESRLEKSAADTRHHVEDALLKIESNQRDSLATKRELGDAIEALTNLKEAGFEKMSTALASVDDKLARFEKMIRRSESRRTAERKEFVLETTGHIDSIGKDIEELKKRNLDLRTQLAKTQAAPGGPVVLSSQSATSPYSYLQQHKELDEVTDVDVESALDTFLSITEKDAATPKSIREIYFYSALLSNCILVEDRDQFGLWQKTVGWESSELIVGASALWVDEDAISKHLLWLLDAEEEPRSLVILDFDLGYTNGYLRPFLRAWRYSSLAAYWKKILLVPSDSEWTIDIGIGHETSVLPRCSTCPTKASISLEKNNHYLSPERLRHFLANLSTKNLELSQQRPDCETGNQRQQDKLLFGLQLDSEPIEEFSRIANQFWKGRERLS